MKEVFLKPHGRLAQSVRFRFRVPLVLNWERRFRVNGLAETCMMERVDLKSDKSRRAAL
jgi:hypothetical protein